MAAEPTAEQLASLAGFTVSFFKSVPELSALFSQALREDWAPDRLLAAARNTEWFKNTSQTRREMHLLREADPEEWERRFQGTRAQIDAMVTELGFAAPSDSLTSLAINALNNGWNEAQIRKALGDWQSAFNRAFNTGRLGGQLAQADTRIRQAALDYGVRLSDKWIRDNLRSIMTGQITEQHALERIQHMAVSAFPGLAEQIQAGQSVRDFADPYIQSMARLWEVNPNQIDLFDPTIRKALTTKNKDGKFSPQSIYDFEVELRKDGRWMRTRNARETVMPIARQVLRDMGIAW